MSLFDVFSKTKPQNTNITDVVDKPVNAPGNDEIIDRNLFVKDKMDDIQNGDNKSVSYQKRIFNFLNSDFESKGYHDALTNPDTKYKNDNIRILEYDLEILVDEAELSYIEYLTDIDFHISSRGKSGLDDLVEELKSKRELIIKKLDFVEKIKKQIETQTGISQRILLAYQRGFIRGLAALTSADIINKNI